MPGYLLNMSCVVQCSHGAKAQPTMPNPRVKIMGQPAPVSTAPFVIAGCPNPPPPYNTGPCVSAPWITPTGTARVKSMGQPLLCLTSRANAVPTGLPLIISFPGQTRVRGL